MALLIALALSELIPFEIAAYLTRHFEGVISNWFNILPSTACYYFLSALCHRFIQFVIVLVIFKFWFKKPLSDLGLNFNNKTKSLHIIKWVVIIWPILVILFFFISTIGIPDFSNYITAQYPVQGSLKYALILRDTLLLDAFAEETLYRGLIFTVLAFAWQETFQFKGKTYKFVTLLSVPFFVLSHISLSVIPFEVFYYDPVQLALTTLTGILFAAIYDQTNSLFAPIVVHGYTNFIITILGLLTSFILT